jgi:hypothetical protein
MGPISSMPGFTEGLNLLFAFLIGIGFGIALEKAGFSSSRKLVGMFYGYDTTVLKVFFTAAIVALVGSQLLSLFGLLDLGKVTVNEFYVLPSIVGGIIMGAGFILGGYCPGTGISALSIGKIDGLVFFFGGMFGAYLFAETYPIIKDFANSTYKGPIKINEVLNLSPWLFTLFLIIIAIAMFWVAEQAEKKFARPEITSDL